MWTVLTILLWFVTSFWKIFEFLNSIFESRYCSILFKLLTKHASIWSVFDSIQGNLILGSSQKKKARSVKSWFVRQTKTIFWSLHFVVMWTVLTILLWFVTSFWRIFELLNSILKANSILFKLLTKNASIWSVFDSIRGEPHPGLISEIEG